MRAALLKANAWGAAADIYNNYADATGVITSGGSAAMNLMQPSLYLCLLYTSDAADEL